MQKVGEHAIARHIFCGNGLKKTSMAHRWASWIYGPRAVRSVSELSPDMHRGLSIEHLHHSGRGCQIIFLMEFQMVFPTQPNYLQRLAVILMVHFRINRATFNDAMSALDLSPLQIAQRITSAVLPLTLFGVLAMGFSPSSVTGGVTR